MLIKFEEIYRDIDTLPEEVQILLLDFIQLLKKRYPQAESEDNSQEKSLYEHPLDTFMERLGPWEDERTAEEIVKDIYDSRTISNNDISL
ncbi:DUF2281 domain-containing protein [Nostoc sp. HG1]|nr:DUF2281 domain-containing protein [Nostoc sp. HG1]